MNHVVILRRLASEENPVEYESHAQKFWWNASGRFTVFLNHATASYALEREKAAGKAWGESRIVSLKELVNAW